MMMATKTIRYSCDILTSLRSRSNSVGMLDDKIAQLEQGRVGVEASQMKQEAERARVLRTSGRYSGWEFTTLANLAAYAFILELVSERADRGVVRRKEQVKQSSSTRVQQPREATSLQTVIDHNFRRSNRRCQTKAG